VTRPRSSPVTFALPGCSTSAAIVWPLVAWTCPRHLDPPARRLDATGGCQVLLGPIPFGEPGLLHLVDRLAEVCQRFKVLVDVGRWVSAEDCPLAVDLPGVRDVVRLEMQTIDYQTQERLSGLGSGLPLSSQTCRWSTVIDCSMLALLIKPCAPAGPGQTQRDFGHATLGRA
jgi:hypothetical protein